MAMVEGAAEKIKEKCHQCCAPNVRRVSCGIAAAAYHAAGIVSGVAPLKDLSIADVALNPGPLSRPAQFLNTSAL